MKNLERGIHKREGRNRRHQQHADRENEKMLQANKGIKIQHWEDPEKPNSWMLIRLKFKNPIIPRNYERELVDVLETEQIAEELACQP